MAEVSPHRLRQCEASLWDSLATRLLNAGMDLTRIEQHSPPLSDQPVVVNHWPVRSELKSLVSADIETRPLRRNLSQMAD